MVKIALAGGWGQVGREVLDALVARGKHEILLLSRQDAPAENLGEGVQWVKTDYNDVTALARTLDGVHTVLSFLAGPIQPTASAQASNQIKLIDASIQAGVKRFAPSEWAMARFEHMFWYSFKKEARDYLARLNEDKKVLEYCLFTPGLFTNYLAYPYQSARHVRVFEQSINFHERRVLVPEGGEDCVMSFTTVQDFARVVALAVEYEGEWPVDGGITGGRTTVGELIAMGEKIRGGRFAVSRLKVEDLGAGVVKAPWLLKLDHPAIPEEAHEVVAPQIVSGVLQGLAAGEWESSDAWNRLLPDFAFTQPEEFLAAAWTAIDAGAERVSFEDY